MRCPRHSQAEVTGYCSVCGEFGCGDCLTLYEGELLCPRHYRPIAEKIEEQRRHENARKRHPRQRLVAHYKDGRCEYGVCFALNPKDNGFHLDLVDANDVPLGKTNHVRFQDLKAVFLVKSFDGKFDKALRYKEWTPEGAELLVRFQDEELIRGFSLRRYDPDEPRFHLIPKEPDTNNIGILVERSSVASVYTPDGYEAMAAAAREAHREAGAPAELTQEETAGDFYFETRNHEAALKEYLKAATKTPNSRRLLKKMLVANYNVGVNFIRKRDFERALSYMEAALKIDPRNVKILKKAAKLRHIIEKGRGGTVALSDPTDDDT